MNEDLSILISELREQVLYLQELGVTSLNADLPEIKVQSPKSKIQNPKSEFVVPDIPIIQKTEPQKVENPQSSIRNSNSPLLSRLPKLSEVSAQKDFPTPIQPRVEVMPKKPVEISPTETLFGDISQTLPESNETLADIKAEIGPDCTRCTLCEKRTQVVNSVGKPTAKLMFIGEAPGADEDAKGEPFVGRAGQLLNKIIEAIGMKREDVFIGNVNRCRPPQNRQPLPDEVVHCKPFLLREIAIVRPKVIVVLGNTACQNLLDTKVGITKLRGNFQDYFGVKVMPTFHPAYLLRDPSKKRETWEDMKNVRDYLNSLE
ncbi:MAG: uracil-DNA glycosylase [Pyrinomonadaceae bacterium]|nr:uracil-DNA glycosylase [Pyrinomonadaceae bacterium]